MAERVVFELRAKDQLTKVFKGVTKEVKNLGTEAKKTATLAKAAFSRLVTSLKAIGTKAVEVAKRMASSFKSAFSKIGSFAKIGFGSVAAGAAAISVGLGASIKAAGEFDLKMREVATLSDTVRNNFDEFGQAIIRSSSGVPDTAVELGEALRILVSAGREGKDSFKLMEQASKLGIVGLSDTATSLGLMVAGMNAFGISSSKAELFADSLFATVKRGQTTLELMAQFLPQVFPVAATIKADPREVLNMFATLSKASGEGLNAQSVTGLASALNVLYSQQVPKDHPLRDFILGLRELEPTQAILKLKQFTDQFPAKQKLAALRQILPDATAAKAVASLITNFADLREGMVFFAKEAPGSVAEGFEIMKDNILVQFKILRGNVINLATQIGQAFLPAVTEIVKTFNEWIGILGKVPWAKVWEQVWGNPEEALPRVKKLIDIVKNEFFSLFKEIPAEQGGGVQSSFIGDFLFRAIEIIKKMSSVIWKPLGTELDIVLEKAGIKFTQVFNAAMAEFLATFEGSFLGARLGITKEKIAALRTSSELAGAAFQPGTRGHAVMTERHAAQREASRQDVARTMLEIRDDVVLGWQAVKDEGIKVFKAIQLEAVGVFRDLETGELRSVAPIGTTRPGGGASQAQLDAAVQTLPKVPEAQAQTNQGVIAVAGDVVEIGTIVSENSIKFLNELGEVREEIKLVKEELKKHGASASKKKAMAGTPQQSFGFAM